MTTGPSRTITTNGIPRTIAVSGPALTVRGATGCDCTVKEAS
jgi:hypothetical protein